MLFVVLMGGPGAGKGTQSRKLQESLGIPQIASGDLFREHFRNETELGKLAHRYIDKGELVPDDVTVEMVRERLLCNDCAGGAILDGFPRTTVQAEALESFLGEMQNPVIITPFIHVSSEVLLRRLSGRLTCQKCGHVFHIEFSPPELPGKCDFDGSLLYQREDDTEETQRRRIQVYYDQTTPLLNYYRQRDLLVEINGDQPMEAVHRDLVAAIQNANEVNAAN
jgi:adenylate kinase